MNERWVRSLYYFCYENFTCAHILTNKKPQLRITNTKRAINGYYFWSFTSVKGLTSQREILN